MLVKPKISIVTPTYNSSKLLEETYDSICLQTYSDWEWLVTDDCSTDSTWDFLENISNNDKRVKIFRNSLNSGAAISRNKSLSHCSGEFVAFIDSDDLWLCDKLEKQLAFMSDNIDFSFTAYELVDEFGMRLNKQVDTRIAESVGYEDMLRKKATLGCSTVMLRRSAFGDLTMPAIRTGQDYALWLKLLKTGKKAYVLKDVLTQYRIVPNSISRNKIRKSMRQWEIYRALENISFFKSLTCFLFYAWRAVFRK